MLRICFPPFSFLILNLIHNHDDADELCEEAFLRSLRNEMERIFLFSNKVEEVSFAELISGQGQNHLGNGL